ncbi:MAG: sigma-70 family RNA polymerase sigma factor [Planctomycetota bacterium]
MTPTSAFSQLVRESAFKLAMDGPKSLGGLFDLTSKRLVRYAVAIARNQHDAEDAVQSALAKVASEPGRLSKADRPWPYLIQMVRNEVLQAARKRKRLRYLSDLRDLLTRCPVDELEQEETHRAVWKALRRLPPPQAEVVVLKIWEDMTFAEIGEMLTISPDTAASRYRYATQKLTKLLATQHFVSREEVLSG